MIHSNVTTSLGINLDISRLVSSTSFIFLFFLIVFLIGVNGLYPAFALSKYQPIEAFKSNKQGYNKGANKLRNALVFFQFAVTQVLIVVTLMIAKQSHYIMEKDLGFKKENILIVKCPSYDETAKRIITATLDAKS